MFVLSYSVRGTGASFEVSANPCLTAVQFPSDVPGLFALPVDSCTDSHVQSRVGCGFGPALICCFLSGFCSENCAEL